MIININIDNKNNTIHDKHSDDIVHDTICFVLVCFSDSVQVAIFFMIGTNGARTRACNRLGVPGTRGRCRTKPCICFHVASFAACSAINSGVTMLAAHARNSCHSLRCDGITDDTASDGTPRRDGGPIDIARSRWCRRWSSSNVTERPRERSTTRGALAGSLWSEASAGKLFAARLSLSSSSISPARRRFTFANGVSTDVVAIDAGKSSVFLFTSSAAACLDAARLREADESFALVISSSSCCCC